MVASAEDGVTYVVSNGQTAVHLERTDDERQCLVPNSPDISNLMKVEIRCKGAEEFQLVGYLNTSDWDAALNVAMVIISRGCMLRLTQTGKCKELSYEAALMHCLCPGDRVSYRIGKSKKSRSDRIERILRVSCGFLLESGVSITLDDLDGGALELINYHRSARPWTRTTS